MTTRKCKLCDVEKEIDAFEKTTAISRRAVCKPCYNKKKAERAKAGSSKIKRDSIPKPDKCAECERSSDEVDFKWRDDVKSGGWRSVCISCYNLRDYSEASRTKRREEDEEGYLKRNAETHLAWAHNNPDKVKAQQDLRKSLPDRKFKMLINYVKTYYSKNVEDVIVFDDADVLQLKMTKNCAYCDYYSTEGFLNGLDRVDPRGKYEDANTVPCCSVCNVMKINFQLDYFIDGVRNIVRHNGLYMNDIVETRPSCFGGTQERRGRIKDKTNTLTENENIDLWSNPCYLCGLCPAFGIDRLDSSKPYEINNCRSCCALCNYMKRDWSYIDFLNHVARINRFTSHWVISDTRNMLSTINCERIPVAPLDDSGEPIMIFPSAACAAKILFNTSANSMNNVLNKNKLYREHHWISVPVDQYKSQTVDLDQCKEFIARTRAYFQN